MKEVILAFGSRDILPLLQRTFAPQKMAVRAVAAAELGETIGALAGLTARGAQSCAGEDIPEPMLLFCGFTSQRIDRALQAMRRTGLKIPYKAVLTEANRQWRPQQLFSELREEHAAVRRGEKAHG